MKFQQALQKLCDEHNVKLIAGIKVGGKRAEASIMAYKLDSNGRVEASHEMPPTISPARKGK
jgi:hypothetical protein